MEGLRTLAALYPFEEFPFFWTISGGCDVWLGVSADPPNNHIGRQTNEVNRVGRPSVDSKEFHSIERQLVEGVDSVHEGRGARGSYFLQVQECSPERWQLIQHARGV